MGQSVNEFLAETLGPGKTPAEVMEMRPGHKRFNSINVGTNTFVAPYAGVDTKTGASVGTRAELSFQGTAAGQEKVLDETFGPGGWKRNSTTGEFQFRTPDGRWALVDEKGLSAKDFVDMLGIVPELSGNIVGAVAGMTAAGKIGKSPTSFVGMSVMAILSSMLGQGAGLIADLLSDSPESLRELGVKRGQAAAVDMALEYFTGGSVAVGKKFLQLFSGPFAKLANEPEQVAVREAAAALGVPTTAFMETGSPTLGRIEAIGEKIPGAGETFKQEAKEIDSSIRTIERGLTTGGDRSAEDIGSDAIRSIETERAAEQTGVEFGVSGPTDIATRDALRNAAGDASQAGTFQQTGQVTRRAFSDRQETFRRVTSEKYNAVRSLPGGRDPIVPMAGVKSESVAIKAELPKDKDIVETLDTGLVDQFGNPITKQVVTEGGPSRAYIPPEVRAFLDNHERLDDFQTIDQVIQMRRIVNDAIRDGEGLPGISTHYLRRLSSALTKALESAPAHTKNPETKAALQEAAQFYANNFEPFLSRGIVDLFRDPTNAGYITDEKIVERLVAGSGDMDLITRYKAFLGPGSAEWGNIQIAVYKRFLDDSESLLLPGQVIDTKKLLNQLDGLSKEAREALFGRTEWEAIQRTLRLASARYGQLDLAHISDLSGGLAESIRNAARVERELQEKYSSNIIAPFLKGETGASTIKPEDFIRHMMTNGSIADIDDVIRLLGPSSDIVSEIRAKAVQLVLDNSARTPTATDVIQALSVQIEGGKVIGGSELLHSLTKTFGADQQTATARLKAIIGEESYEILRQLGIVQAARERKREMAQAAGGLISGSILSNLIQGNLKVLPLLVKYKVVSLIVTMPGGKKWLKSKAQLKNTKVGNLSALLAGPFLNDLYQEFKDDPDAFGAVLDALGTDSKRPPVGIGIGAGAFLNQYKQTAGSQ